MKRHRTFEIVILNIDLNAPDGHRIGSAHVLVPNESGNSATFEKSPEIVRVFRRGKGGDSFQIDLEVIMNRPGLARLVRPRGCVPALASLASGLEPG